MSKQDRQGARTAADIESRYNFRKSFSEVMGVAKDARKIAEQASVLDEKLTSEEIFIRLTNNGQLQGLYRGDDGELYVNATYIKSGEINADVVKIKNLTVGAAQITGTLSGDRIDGSKLTIKNGATIGAWKVSGNVLTSEKTDEYGEIVDSVYIEPERLLYIRNQSAGDGVITSWENVALAGRAVGNGVSGSFTIGGNTFTFTNGILTSVT